MRDILFRGKTESGDWAYGSFHLQDGETKKDGSCDAEYRILGMRGQCDYVVPETVGQFTGLTDKNGKKIFEGDILSFTEEIETRSRCKETLKGIYEVKFEYCGFSPLDCLACNHLEIIGNIYETPELLKGGGEE